MEEVWKDIAGFEGYYQISNNGKIKSLSRKIPNGKRLRSIREKILKPVFNGKNLEIRLNNEDVGKQYGVSRTAIYQIVTRKKWKHI